MIPTTTVTAPRNWTPPLLLPPRNLPAAQRRPAPPPLPQIALSLTWKWKSVYHPNSRKKPKIKVLVPEEPLKKPGIKIRIPFPPQTEPPLYSDSEFGLSL